VDSSGRHIALAPGGNIVKSNSTFKIDHPLEPTSKYLSHSSFESPDMKNLYDGVAELDAQGEAVVELPVWFEALNKEIRGLRASESARGPCS